MRGTTSDAAAIAINRACLHKLERDLDPTDLAKIEGAAQYMDYEGSSLRVELENNSHYLITRLTIRIQRLGKATFKDYTATEFAPPFAKFLDPTRSLSIAPGDKRAHFFSISEKESAEGAFFKTYSWAIVSAKGVA